MWPYSVPGFVYLCKNSGRFVIIPLWTLQLLHYCLVRQKETVHLEPDALWVVVIITVKYCLSIVPSCVSTHTSPVHGKPQYLYKCVRITQAHMFLYNTQDFHKSELKQHHQMQPWTQTFTTQVVL